MTGKKRELLGKWKQWLSIEWHRAKDYEDSQHFFDQLNYKPCSFDEKEWKHVSLLMSNVQSLIWHYETEENSKNLYKITSIDDENIFNSSEKVELGGKRTYDKAGCSIKSDAPNVLKESEAPGNEQMSMFGDYRIWETYKEYGFLCVDEFLKYEKENECKFEGFRIRFFVGEMDNSQLLRNIGTRKWETT